MTLVFSELNHEVEVRKFKLLMKFWKIYKLSINLHILVLICIIFLYPACFLVNYCLKMYCAIYSNLYVWWLWFCWYQHFTENKKSVRYLFFIVKKSLVCSVCYSEVMLQHNYIKTLRKRKWSISVSTFHFTSHDAEQAQCVQMCGFVARFESQATKLVMCLPHITGSFLTEIFAFLWHAGLAFKFPTVPVHSVFTLVFLHGIFSSSPSSSFPGCFRCAVSLRLWNFLRSEQNKTWSKRDTLWLQWTCYKRQTVCRNWHSQTAPSQRRVPTAFEKNLLCRNIRLNILLPVFKTRAWTIPLNRYVNTDQYLCLVSLWYSSVHCWQRIYSHV